MNSRVKGERSMKTKSLLLSLPLILSGLILASFPANAAYWAGRAELNYVLGVSWEKE